MHLKSISTTPSLISLSVTPGPVPATCAAIAVVVGPFAELAALLLLPHAAAISKEPTTSAVDEPPSTHAPNSTHDQGRGHARPHAAVSEAQRSELAEFLAKELCKFDEVEEVVGPVVEDAVGHQRARGRARAR